MTQIKLEFPGSQYCSRASSNKIPAYMIRGKTTLTATRFVGGLLNNGHHLFWHQLQPILSLGALSQQYQKIFTFLPYRLYSNEQGALIDGVRIRHKGHKYGFSGGRAKVHLYQPKLNFGRRANVSCIPWQLYFIYQFEDIYVVFELKEHLYIPHQLLPIVRTPR